MIPPRLSGLFLLLWFSGSNAAVYQTPEDYLKDVFGQAVPKPQLLWMTKSIKQQAATILAHPIKFLRTRYWRESTKTAWILEEIGKTKPITVGVTVNAGRITNIKVLAFRESRGWEVKQPFFTNQFSQAALNEKFELDKTIDGISGATLSVRALKKTAKLALLLDQHVPK